MTMRHDDRQDDADDGSERPFERADLRHDDIAEQVDLASGQRGAGREFAEHHDADKNRADDDAGQAQREDDLAQHPPEARAEIARGFEDIRIDAAEHEGDRPDHEHDIDLRHADHDREIGEQQRLDRLVDDSRLHQDDVDRPLFAEHGPPRDHADQERGPERNDAENQERRLQRLVLDEQADEQRGRIADARRSVTRTISQMRIVVQSELR